MISEYFGPVFVIIIVLVIATGIIWIFALLTFVKAIFWPAVIIVKQISPEEAERAAAAEKESVQREYVKIWVPRNAGIAANQNDLP